MGIQTYLDSKQIIITDTVPGSELHNIKWNTVNRLLAAHGVLIAKLYNGDSLIIARKDYEDYAAKNTKIDELGDTFKQVEIEPEYPGGADSWTAYVKKNIKLPVVAIDKRIQGTVVVLFIVEKDGTLNDVEAVAGPTRGGIRQEAVRLVKMSGKWNTAIQNFRIVRAYKKQAVIFATEEK